MTSPPTPCLLRGLHSTSTSARRRPARRRPRCAFRCILAAFKLAPSLVLPNSITLCRAWTPFSLLAKCDVKHPGARNPQCLMVLRVFKLHGALSDPREEDSHYFAPGSGEQADVVARDAWVKAFSSALTAFRLSLFPPCCIEVRPIPEVPSTSSRIMAGYLLLGEADNGAVLLYCELRGFLLGEASFAMYSDDRCVEQVAVWPITGTSHMVAQIGLDSTVFMVCTRLFCARTAGEARLWLRALLNVRTKLTFDAPDPTLEDLAIFRAAVCECLPQLPQVPESSVAKPMLELKPRSPMPYSPIGDILPVEPAKTPEAARELSKRNEVFCALSMVAGGVPCYNADVAAEYDGGSVRRSFATSCGTSPSPLNGLAGMDNKAHKVSFWC
eukprot:NODE_4875_length_1835_cov_7.299180.p1 GENE.NODE_4875_length_1835_cov_7.299180~~NODE_4875_length_1835_cov_7.299180.p1  ORF type:complete len:385 (+),score=64.70 NODE_4875_length_1835_cov_7.299180:446-1600(+)